MGRSLCTTLLLAMLTSVASLTIFYVWLSTSRSRLHHFNRRFIVFWYNDIPPMNDTCRIILYGGLLIISLLSPLSQPHLGDSPLQALEIYKYTLPEYFLRIGFMQVVPRALLTHTSVRRIRFVCVVAWISCIVSFGGTWSYALVGGTWSYALVGGTWSYALVGGTWSYALVGLCVLILHGIVTGCTGANHRWYTPVYTLLALALCHGNGSFSVDHYFASRYNNYPFTKPIGTSLLVSGFSRKAALALSLLTLFFGGVAKLMNSGICWMDGNTLAFYIGDESVGHWHWLKRLISKSKRFSALLSIMTILFQLGAPCALFIPALRSYIIALAMMFHFGIWLTMYPNYLPQTWCYLVGLSMGAAATLDEQNYTLVNVTTLCASWGVTWLLIFSTICALFGIEYWPLTSVSMYSFYRDESYNYHYFIDVEQILHISKECLSSNATDLMPHIYLRLFNSATKSYELDKLVFQTYVNEGVLIAQWRRIQTIIVTYDLMVKSQFQLKTNTILSIRSHHSAESWLWKDVGYWRSKHWPLPIWTFRRNVELQLVACIKDDSSLVLAYIPWLEK